MTRRLSFLLGNLTGIAVGGLLVFVYLSNQPSLLNTSPPLTVPSQYVVPVNYAGDEIPPSWERREFNGRPFYIVPLSEPNA